MCAARRRFPAQTEFFTEKRFFKSLCATGRAGVGEENAGEIGSCAIFEFCAPTLAR